MTEFDDLPKIVLPGTCSHGYWGSYWDVYKVADHLDRLYPGQDAHDFFYAIYNNQGDFTINGEPIVGNVAYLKCLLKGENGGSPWIWVAVMDKHFIVLSGCHDYTGWDRSTIKVGSLGESTRDEQLEIVSSYIAEAKRDWS